MQLVNLSIGNSGGRNKPQNMRSVLKELLDTEGMRGLGKGFSLNILKGPITMSLSLTTYDMLMRKCKERERGN